MLAKLGIADILGKPLKQLFLKSPLGVAAKRAAEIVSGLSGKNTCLMKSSPLPRMLLQAWRRVEPKWSRKVSSAERNNCEVTPAPQARVLISNDGCPNQDRTSGPGAGLF